MQTLHWPSPKTLQRFPARVRSSFDCFDLNYCSHVPLESSHAKPSGPSTRSANRKQDYHFRVNLRNTPVRREKRKSLALATAPSSDFFDRKPIQVKLVPPFLRGPDSPTCQPVTPLTSWLRRTLTQNRATDGHGVGHAQVQRRSGSACGLDVVHRQDDDFGPDAGASVEVNHILIQHADAAA